MGALAMAAVGFTKLATNSSIPTPDACRNRSARTASITNSSIPSQQQISPQELETEIEKEPTHLFCQSWKP